MGSDGYEELPSWLPAHAGVTRSPPINCPRSLLAPRAHGRDHHCRSSLNSTAAGLAITSTVPARHSTRSVLRSMRSTNRRWHSDSRLGQVRLKLTATRSVVAAPATNFSTATVSLWERTFPKSGLLFPNSVSMATCLTEAIFYKTGIKPFRFILDALPCMLAPPRARA